MLTRLRIVAACFSLMLCFLFTALWISSYRVEQHVSGPLGNKRLGFSSWLGYFSIAYEPNGEVPPILLRFSLTTASVLREFGAGHWRLSPGPSYVDLRSGNWKVSSPYWLVVLLTACVAVVLKPYPRRQISLAEMLIVTALLATAFGACSIFLAWAGVPA